MEMRVRDYSRVGRRIAGLAPRQQDIAEALGMSQQNVSNKLHGRTAILLADLEKLARHFDVPLTYFFEDGNEHPALAKALQKVRERPGPLQEVVVRLALMSDSAVNDALDIIKLVMRNDSGHEKAPCTAAEARAQYGHSK